MDRFVTEDSFWKLFPGASFGIVIARNMLPSEDVPEDDRKELSDLLRRANARAERFLTSSTISEIEPVKVWRGVIGVSRPSEVPAAASRIF